MGSEFTKAQVLAMERAAARAWPSVDAVEVDGWVWRSSGGGSRRANSVLPLAFTGLDPEAAIERIEALYQAQGLRTYFQVSSIAAPADLDDRLARRGYMHEEPVLLLAKALPKTAPATISADVEVMAEPSQDWLAIYSSTVDAIRQAAVPATLMRVPKNKAFLVVRREGQPLATALCVVSPDGVAIVECVATDPSRRRTGAAREVMEALETWAASAGATVVALQVVEANTPARALYEARGYRQAGRYHYRWSDAGGKH